MVALWNIVELRSGTDGFCGDLGDGHGLQRAGRSGGQLRWRGGWVALKHLPVSQMISR